MDYEAYGKKAALRVEKFTRIAKDPAIALRASEIGSYIEPEEATGINNFRNIHSNFLERECSELSGSLGLRFEQPRTLEESRKIIDGISSAIATIADADNKNLWKGFRQLFDQRPHRGQTEVSKACTSKGVDNEQLFVRKPRISLSQKFQHLRFRPWFKRRYSANK